MVYIVHDPGCTSVKTRKEVQPLSDLAKFLRW